MDCKTFIKVFLAQNNSNVSELARRTGTTSQNLRGKLARNDFRVSDLERIAAAYGCTLKIEFIPPDQ